MRKIISLFLLVFLISYPVSAQDKADSLNEWDFGQVKQEQILKHDFVFKNETNVVLNIASVNTSCGCTASQADKKSLEPGESTTISVAFSTKKYVGEVKQFVYLNTDNQDLPVVKFVIKAEVLKEA
ncbi:MAG: hypothetical protein COV71_02140 [Candidatus Omnitrophica bacterium CG11_big_fil_rev_8_21_14_0_20_41_12]|nr:MAG: hypothetical protein COV71_02140 [Candidatus Omnitrophica bacterium CG11_big_fil_rev_8_21_14_0_20_41_12]